MPLAVLLCPTTLLLRALSRRLILPTLPTRC
jgi:hypothetical protein